MSRDKSLYEIAMMLDRHWDCLLALHDKIEDVRYHLAKVQDGYFVVSGDFKKLKLKIEEAKNDKS